MVNFRPLPASLGSKLKYQATCLWPYLSEGAQNDQLLPQYIERYQSCNEDSSKVSGEGRRYWIHDFVATYRVNKRPIYMAIGTIEL